MKLGYVYSPIFLMHSAAGHPEAPQRLEAILQVWQDMHLTDALLTIEPTPATEERLRRVHSQKHLNTIEYGDRRGGIQIDGDTYMNQYSRDAAYLAAGAAINAVDAVMTGIVDASFSLARPPGHHATRDLAMGFCLFNNVAVAAQYAIDHYHLERVLIVDFDVHHGNGTQDIFYAQSDVFYFSTHRYPFYPGSGHWRDVGAETGRGYTLNVPLPHSVGNAQFARVFDELLYPAMKRYQPQLVLVSAGYDAHWADPLGALTLLDSAGYFYITQALHNIAREFAQGRIVFILEGGYNFDALAWSSYASARALLGKTNDDDPVGPPPRAAQDITDLIAHLKNLHRLD
ncbi:MAG: Histone deacetylase-like amidohydrolase [Anaerolineae bacterium]|nr:Histone deacetylase-like amidohydrolase [Anaerolineae bacterium]